MDTTNTNHNTPRGAQTQTHDDMVSPEEHVDTSAPASASAPAYCEATTPPSRDAQDPPPAATEPESATPASSPRKAHRWATLLGTPAAGWAATAIATLIAALIRLPGLDNVRTLIFDETYYVKDAWSLLTLGYEGTWPQNYDPTFAVGNTSGLSATASYAVHPPTGKWLIALGMQIFGQANPVGWRITTAICGVITVLLLCRLAHNLFRNPALTLIAGLFLATDGLAIVMSRTSILDGFLTMFSLAAFLCFVKDQQMSQPTLERKLRSWERIGAPRAGWRAFGRYLTLRDWRGIAIGPNAGNRPWLLAAGILSGLACSVKWSGIYVLACLGLFVALREITCRWRAGHPSPIIGALLADVWWAFILMVPTAILTYIASWFSWFTHPQAYGHGRSGISGFGGALVDLWIYHKGMWTFHNGLETPHRYQSNPLTWLIQVRPTSFYWKNDDSITGCPAGNCATDIVALGNPILWWLGIGALLIVICATLYVRNWRAGVILTGYLALYAPWLAYAHRTIFTFYTVAFAPFVALAVAWMVSLLAGIETPDGTPPDTPAALAAPVPRTTVIMGRVMAAALIIAILGCAISFMPLWRADVIDYTYWRAHMWLSSWI